MELMTSAQAAKELKKLNELHNILKTAENKASVFTVTTQENIEDVRPIYDYEKMQSELANTEEKIRRLKHSVNKFNLTQVIPEFDMTVDQMLVYIPQLTARRNKLEQMCTRLQKERMTNIYGRSSDMTEYKYCNYDVKKANEDYMKTLDELAKAQTALDAVNSTVKFEVDI